MYTTDRNAYRQTFIQAWHKYQHRLPLEAVESQLVDIILLHPEYQALLEQAQSHEFAPADNPFLHMSLHLVVNDQLRINRPLGIQQAYQAILMKVGQGQEHEAMHIVMKALAEILWEAQQTNTPPSEEAYLHKLTRNSSQMTR